MPVQAPPLQEISFLVAPEFLARRGHFSPGGFSETAATCHCLFRVSLLPIASFHSLEGPHCGRGRIGSGFLNANLTSEVNDKWLPGSEGQFHTAKAGWRCRPCRGAVPPSGACFIIMCLSGKSGGAPNVFTSNFISKRFMCSSP